MKTRIPMPVISNSRPIPCGSVMPTYNPNSTSTQPIASRVLARKNTPMLGSDVYPGRHEDVLDVERVTQCHLDHHAHHRDEQKSGDSETHRSPRLEDLFTTAGKCRPWIAGGSPSDPPIKARVADHEIRPDYHQPEHRGQKVIAESEQVRQIDVGQR